MSVKENVNHPSHYNQGNIEAIEVVEDWKLGFCLGNVIKYISRAEHKNSPIEDLKKAAWYLNREIESRTKKLEALESLKTDEPTQMCNKTQSMERWKGIVPS